jgi:hypothetical protein
MSVVSEARPWWQLWVVCCLLEVSTATCGVPPEESSDSRSPPERVNDFIEGVSYFLAQR